MKGPSQQKVFDNIKHMSHKTPVLAYQNFDLSFMLTMDASKVAVAAILSQMQDGVEWPIAYASREMNKAEHAYSAS